MLLFPEKLSFKGMGHVDMPLTSADLYDLGWATSEAFRMVLSSKEIMKATGLDGVMQAVPSQIEVEVAIATKRRYRVERLKTSNSVWNDQQILGIISCEKFGQHLSGDVARIRRWFNGSRPRDGRSSSLSLKGAIASGFIFDDLKKIKIFFSASSHGQKICSYCEWRLRVSFDLIEGKYEVRETMAVGQVLQLEATKTGCAGYIKMENHGEIEADAKLRVEEEMK